MIRDKIIEQRMFEKDFLKSMIDKLDVIFPKGWCEEEYCMEEGTSGWHTALKTTCEELNIPEILDYYDSFDDYKDVDDIDEDLGEALINFRRKNN